MSCLKAHRAEVTQCRAVSSTGNIAASLIRVIALCAMRPLNCYSNVTGLESWVTGSRVWINKSFPENFYIFFA